MRSWTLVLAVACVVMSVGAWAQNAVEPVGQTASPQAIAPVPSTLKAVAPVPSNLEAVTPAGTRPEAEDDTAEGEGAALEAPPMPSGPMPAALAPEPVDDVGPASAEFAPFDAVELVPDASPPPAELGEVESEGGAPSEESSWGGSFGQSSAIALAPVQPVVRVSSKGITLGPLGVDPEGRVGRIHTVASGHTLWDISEAYLGTPWVWPSVWNDNDDIDNPHLINPGDKIWVSSTEMRRITEQEALDYVAAAPGPGRVIEPPAAAEEDLAGGDELDLEPATMDQLPVGVPLQGKDGLETGRSVRIANREGMSFVASRAIDASTSIVDSSVPRIWLAEGDSVVVGLGEGGIEEEQQLTIFREADEVVDPRSGALLGYHVHVLGWLEVTRVDSEASEAIVRQSVSEIERGDRVLPREPLDAEIPVKWAIDGIEGIVTYMPDNRTEASQQDYVYINRGTIHGVDVGTMLEAYEPGRLRVDKVRAVTVRSPDYSVAKMVVVSTQPDSAVAFIEDASRELEMGDLVRGVQRPQSVASQ